MRKTIIALALAAASTAAAAQQIYKYATPDGNVVYTDNPAAGLNGAKKLELPTSASAAVSPRLYGAERGAPTGAEQAVALPVAESASAAQIEYRAAKRRRVEGVTPLPGERDGPYFHPAYWQRQRELAQGLTQARARLSHTSPTTVAQRQPYSLALAQQ